MRIEPTKFFCVFYYPVLMSAFVQKLGGKMWATVMMVVLFSYLTAPIGKMWATVVMVVLFSYLTAAPVPKLNYQRYCRQLLPVCGVVCSGAVGRGNYRNVELS